MGYDWKAKRDKKRQKRIDKNNKNCVTVYKNQIGLVRFVKISYADWEQVKPHTDIFKRQGTLYGLGLQIENKVYIDGTHFKYINANNNHIEEVYEGIPDWASGELIALYENNMAGADEPVEEEQENNYELITEMEEKEMNNVTCEFLLITPEDAKKLLEKNESNRHIKNMVVSKYAEDMKNGRWEINGEAICIDENGNLKNGQHRLNAVIKANVPITFLVASGISSDVSNYDRGRARTIVDNMVMSGKFEKNVTTAKAVSLARFCIMYGANGEEKSKSNISDGELKCFISENSKLVGEIIRVSKPNSSGQYGTHRLINRGGILAAMFFALCSGESIEVISKFLSTAESGMYNGETESSAIVFRNYLLRARGRGGKDVEKGIFSTAQEAFEDFASGTPRKKNYPGKATPYLDKYVIERFGHKIVSSSDV